MARKPQLLTKAIEKQLDKAPMGSTEEGLEDAPVIVKFFSPFPGWEFSGATWYVVEAQRLQDGDWHFFGLLDHKGSKTLRDFLLSDLKVTKMNGRLPLVERDCYFGNHSLKEFLY